MDSGLEFVRVWHKVFSQNLAYVIEGIQPDNSLEVEVISNSGICQVGRWLAVQRPEVVQLPSFPNLVTIHDRYHQVAGEMLRLFQAGQIDDAKGLMAGEFTSSSEGVCEQIDVLEAELVSANLAAPRFKAEDVARSHTFWNSTFEVGIESVDRRHHAIAMLIEELSTSSLLYITQEQAGVFIKILSNLMNDDIKAEAPILDQHKGSEDPYFTEHIAAHEMITAHLEGLAKKVEEGVAISVKEVATHFAEWFVSHLVEFDLELPNHMPASGAAS